MNSTPHVSRASVFSAGPFPSLSFLAVLPHSSICDSDGKQINTASTDFPPSRKKGAGTPLLDRGEININTNIIYFFQHVDVRDETQVLGLGDKCVYPWSYFVVYVYTFCAHRRTCVHARVCAEERV